jgi:hypothetical protein
MAKAWKVFGLIAVVAAGSFAPAYQGLQQAVVSRVGGCFGPVGGIGLVKNLYSK